MILNFQTILFCLPGFAEKIIDSIQPPILLIHIFIPSSYLEGSGKILEIAKEKGIPVTALGNLSSEEVLNFIRKLDPSLIISSSYNEKFPAALLKLLKYGALNIHPSLLPFFRRPDPCFWAIKKGESQTGLSIHYMNEEFDKGEILVQRKLKITEEETSGSLFNKMSDLLPVLLKEAFVKLIQTEGSPDKLPQKENEGSYFGKVKNSTLYLKPETMTANEAHKLIRAANPFYGARISCGSTFIKIWQASIRKEPLINSVKSGKYFFTEGIYFFLKMKEDFIFPEIVQFADLQLCTNELFLKKYKAYLD